MCRKSRLLASLIKTVVEVVGRGQWGTPSSWPSGQPSASPESKVSLEILRGAVYRQQLTIALKCSYIASLQTWP
jgi:hypothetical protein